MTTPIFNKNDINTLEEAKNYPNYHGGALSQAEKEIFDSPLLAPDGTLDVSLLQDTARLLNVCKEAQANLKIEKTSETGLSTDGNALLIALMEQRRNNSIAYQLVNEKDADEEGRVDKMVREYQKVLFRKNNKLKQVNQIRTQELNSKVQSNKKQLRKKEQELAEIDSKIVNLKKKLSLEDKFSQLLHITQGLKDLHQKNLVHHDFHSGNILKGIEKTSCLITDLGLCKPVNETSPEKVFGVLPYVAPEVLQSQPYTQASDVYSFAVVAYELFSGLPPYYDQVHDVNLGVKICQGLRPQFQIKIPQLLEDLVNRCWDKDPTKRPTAYELESILRSWGVNTEFQNQLQVAEAFNQALPNEIRFPNYQIHHGAVYHSKLLPTKEITQLMQNFNFQTKAIELNTQWIKVKQLAEEVKTNKNKESSHNNSGENEKYNEFKKALKLALETSKELEKIFASSPLISDDAKELLKKTRERLDSSEQSCQKIKAKIEQKEQELAELKKDIVSNNDKIDTADLSQITELLAKQEALVKNGDEESLKKLELTKRTVLKLKIASEAKINNLCQKQEEITQLELELQKNIDHQTKQINQIINNINVQQGHAFVGNTFGDQANITYNNIQTESKVEVPPKK